MKQYLKIIIIILLLVFLVTFVGPWIELFNDPTFQGNNLVFQERILEVTAATLIYFFMAIGGIMGRLRGINQS